jgi:hypothetical protein
VHTRPARDLRVGLSVPLSILEIDMNKTPRVLTLALVLAAGLIGGAISGRMNYSIPTQAQQASRPRARDRWEYCSLSKALVGQSRGGLYWISYFRNSGVQVVEVEEMATESSGPAKGIAKLGDEGWEMVGEGPLEMRAGGINAIYFKRLRP